MGKPCRLDFFWLRLQGLKPENFSKGRFKPLGEVEFLVFTGKLLGGLCTPLGTICINKRLLGNSLLKELILLHEYAHKKDPLRLIFYSTGILILFSTFIWGLIGALTTLASTILLSWIMELKAETYTVKHMGKKYFEAKTETEKLRKGRLPPIYKLLNPPKTLEKRLVNQLTKQ